MKLDEIRKGWLDEAKNSVDGASFRRHEAKLSAHSMSTKLCDNEPFFCSCVTAPYAI